MIPLLILFMIFVLLLFILTMVFDNLILSWMSSVMIIILGVYTMIYGIIGQVNLLTRGISLLFLGLGMYIMIISSLDFFEGMEEES